MNTAVHGHGNVVGDGNTVTVIVNGRKETRLFVNVPPKPALLVGATHVCATSTTSAGFI